MNTESLQTADELEHSEKDKESLFTMILQEFVLLLACIDTVFLILILFLMVYVVVRYIIRLKIRSKFVMLFYLLAFLTTTC